MQRKSLVAISLAIIIIAAVALVVIYTNFSGSSSLSISIEPQKTNKLSIGSTFVVNVTTKGCVNMTGVQVNVRFNPQVLNITDMGIVEGALLESVNAIVDTPVIGSLNGTNPPSVSLTFQAASFNLTGDGVLFSISFKVISDGSTKIQLYPFQQSTEIGTFFYWQNISTPVQSKNFVPALYDASYGSS